MLKKRAKFKAHGSNPLKKYRRKYTDYQVACFANCARQDRLNHPTLAEQAFNALLEELGIDFTREKIFQNGDRWILVDFYLNEKKIAIEIDGSVHKDQKVYDQQRTSWLNDRGVTVIRFKNSQVLKHRDVVINDLQTLLR